MKLTILFSIITGTAAMLFFQTNSPAVSGLDKYQSGKTAPSPQYIEGKFNNKAEQLNISIADFLSTTWDFLFGGRNRTPDMELPLKSVDLSQFNGSAVHQLNATWLGHSSLMINIDFQVAV